MRARNLIALLFIVLFIVAGCATRPVAMTDLERHEHELTRAIARFDRATLSKLVADDFSCEVTGPTHPHVVRSVIACTGLGHRPGGNEQLFKEQTDGPRRRSASIEGVEVARSGDTAVVRSLQTYRGWQPYDLNYARQSRVTDTWQRREDRWVLVRRVSEPVEDNYSHRIVKSISHFLNFPSYGGKSSSMALNGSR
jgi:hypothetical protein